MGPPLVILAALGGTLVGSDRLAFRDVSHFYTPLYEYVADRGQESWLPLWNPLDNTGLPLWGENTTAFFYPPRYLLFALPLGASVAMGWYVALHLVGAFYAARWLARRAGCSAAAASLAGVTYAFSGPVHFLYSNPPFLVGACWLPLALGGLVYCPGGWRPATLVSAIALAMMVLGGDPQTAAHAGLVGLVIVAVRHLTGGDVSRPRERPHADRRPNADRRSDADGHPRVGEISRVAVSRQPDGGRSSGRWIPIFAAPLLAAALAAPQLAASIDWGRHSARLESKGVADWWRPPASGSHRREAFEFSVPPWRMAEWVTPDAGGRMLPQNHRWVGWLSGEERVWTPTLYGGMLALVALTTRLVRFRRDGWDIGLALIVIGTLASWGHYGPAWLARSLAWGLTGIEWWPEIDGAVGGPYWLFHHAVPGYSAFRYPAKWLPLVSLGLALTAGRWADGLAAAAVRAERAPAERAPAGGRVERAGIRPGIQPVASWLVVVGILAIGWLGLAFATPAQGMERWLVDRFGELPADRFWGPLSLAGAGRDLGRSLIHSLVMLAALAAVLVWLGKDRRRLPAGLLAVALIDLGMVARSITHTVPVAAEHALLETLEATGDGPPEVRSPPTRWLRTQSQGGWPGRWRTTSSPHRLLEVEASQRASWFGRWHLADRQAVFNAMTTLRSSQIDRFWDRVGPAMKDLSAAERARFWAKLRSRWGIAGQSHTTAADTRVADDRETLLLATVDRRESAEAASPEGLRLFADWKAVASAESRRHWDAWLASVRDGDADAPPWVILPPAAAREPSRDAAQEPSTARPDSPSAPVRCLTWGPDSVEVLVDTATGGLLRRAAFQDGWWQARLESADVPTDSPPSPAAGLAVHPVDFLSQGVFVPPGRWKVTFTYRPGWLWPSLTVTAIAWAAAFAWITSLARLARVAGMPSRGGAARRVRVAKKRGKKRL